MEYLTINEHHRSHYRGMESFNRNHYDSRAVEAIPRPLIPQSSESRRTPPVSNRPGEDPSWHQPRSQGISLLNSPHLPPLTLLPGQSQILSTSSAASAPLPAGSENRNERLAAGPNEWGRSTQAPPQNMTPTAEPPREREDPKGVSLPSFNSVSRNGADL
jgi:hypothetical protein